MADDPIDPGTALAWWRVQTDLETLWRSPELQHANAAGIRDLVANLAAMCLDFEEVAGSAPTTVALMAKMGAGFIRSRKLTQDAPTIAKMEQARREWTEEKGKQRPRSKEAFKRDCAARLSVSPRTVERWLAGV